MAKQVGAIKRAIGEPETQEFDVTVRAALCFVDAEWSLFAKPFALDGVWIGWAKALGTRLREEGALAPEHVAAESQKHYRPPDVVRRATAVDPGVRIVVTRGSAAPHRALTGTAQIFSVRGRDSAPV